MGTIVLPIALPAIPVPTMRLVCMSAKSRPFYLMPRPRGLASPLGRPRPRAVSLPVAVDELPRAEGRRDCRVSAARVFEVDLVIAVGFSTNEVSVVLWQLVRFSSWLDRDPEMYLHKCCVTIVFRPSVG